MMESFYSSHELSKFRFGNIGKNVQLSRKASIYSPEKIIIGDNVRIDDFCILSGEITLGSNIHISAYSALYGGSGITINDYSGLSPRSTIYSTIDDFGGDYLIGPIHSDSNTRLIKGKVCLERFTQTGANTIIFPGVTLHEGAVSGAFSLINQDLEAWYIYIGIPAKKHRKRSMNCLNLT